jgi:integrase
VVLFAFEGNAQRRHPSGPLRFHDLRHGVATALAKAGTPAYVTARVLGHASPYFTAATYQHADDEQVDRALAGLEAAFGTGS